MLIAMHRAWVNYKTVGTEQNLSTGRGVRVVDCVSKDGCNNISHQGWSLSPHPFKSGLAQALFLSKEYDEQWCVLLRLGPKRSQLVLHHFEYSFLECSCHVKKPKLAQWRGRDRSQPPRQPCQGTTRVSEALLVLQTQTPSESNLMKEAS